MTLSFAVSEKTAGQNDFLKTENQPYLPTGSEFNKKLHLVHFIPHLF
jgi:hypothetical protein